MKSVAKIITELALALSGQMAVAQNIESQSSRTIERKILISLLEREVRLVKSKGLISSAGKKKFCWCNIYRLQLDSLNIDSKKNLMIRFDRNKHDHSVRQIIGLLSDLAI